MGGHRDSHIDRLIRPAGSAHAMNGSGCRPGPTKWLNFLIPLSHLLARSAPELEAGHTAPPPGKILMLPDTCLGGNGKCTASIPTLRLHIPPHSTHLTAPICRPSASGSAKPPNENPDLHRPCNPTCRTNFSARLCNSGWHNRPHLINARHGYALMG